MLLLCINTKLKDVSGANILANTEEALRRHPGTNHLTVEATVEAVGFYLKPGYIFCNSDGAPSNLNGMVIDDESYLEDYRFNSFTYDEDRNGRMRYTGATRLQKDILALVPLNNNGKDETDGSWDEKDETFRMIKNL